MKTVQVQPGGEWVYADRHGWVSGPAGDEATTFQPSFGAHGAVHVGRDGR